MHWLICTPRILGLTFILSSFSPLFLPENGESMDTKYASHSFCIAVGGGGKELPKPQYSNENAHE